MVMSLTVEDSFLREFKVSNMLMMYPNRIKRYVILSANRFVDDDRIKPQYFMFIPYIAEYDGISQKDLNSYLRFDKSYVSTIVRELIEKDMVYNDGSGKTYSLHLTDRGRELYAVCLTVSEKAQRELLEDFTEEELKCFSDVFTRFNDKLDRMLDELSASETNLFCDKDMY